MGYWAEVRHSTRSLKRSETQQARGPWDVVPASHIFLWGVWGASGPAEGRALAPYVLWTRPFNHSSLSVTFQSSVGSRNIRRQFPRGPDRTHPFCTCVSIPYLIWLDVVKTIHHPKSLHPGPQNHNHQNPDISLKCRSWSSDPAHASLMSGTPSRIFRDPFLLFGLGCQEEARGLWPLKTQIGELRPGKSRSPGTQSPLAGACLARPWGPSAERGMG